MLRKKTLSRPEEWGAQRPTAAVHENMYCAEWWDEQGIKDLKRCERQWSWPSFRYRMMPVSVWRQRRKLLKPDSTAGTRAGIWTEEVMHMADGDWKYADRKEQLSCRVHRTGSMRGAAVLQSTRDSDGCHKWSGLKNTKHLQLWAHLQQEVVTPAPFRCAVCCTWLPRRKNDNVTIHVCAWWLCWYPSAYFGAKD
jgi:hypothetical protein